MRIRNADGSESGTCGNATRCVAAVLAAEVRPRPRHGAHDRRRSGLRAPAGRPRARRHGRPPPRLARRPPGARGRHPAPAAARRPGRAQHGQPARDLLRGGPRRGGSPRRRAGTRPAVRRACQHRLRPRPGAGPHPPAGVGARHRPDAGLRLRRLRRPGQRRAPRPVRPARRDPDGWRHPGDRVARRRPRVDDRPRGDELHRHPGPVFLRPGMQGPLAFAGSGQSPALLASF